MADSEQDKSELPTPYKLSEARRKGTVARGMDLAFLSGIAALLACAWIAGPQTMLDLSRWMKAALISSTELSENPSSVLALVSALFFGMAKPILYIAVAVFSLTLLVEIVQTGVVFSAHPLKPDFSRLNPAKGLKRLFSMRLLIETLKNIVKLTVYVVIAYLIIEQVIRTETPAIDDAAMLALASQRSVMRLFAAFALAAIVFAAIDQLISRRQFLKTMRMSRRDVRRESRDREGDPRLKQKRKQLHGEFAKLSQGLRNLKGADVLIVNPQHVAVALRYEAKTMHAPLVVSMGVNQLAQRMKRMAMLYNIPVIENPPLARALLRKAALNAFVPESHFGAVAEIYNHIRRARRAPQPDA
jgi:flagellar biosynthetic protein FlhB